MKWLVSPIFLPNVYFVSVPNFIHSICQYRPWIIQWIFPTIRSDKSYRTYQQERNRTIFWGHHYLKKLVASKFPNLSPSNFFLWWYRYKPHTIADLKDIIRQEIEANTNTLVKMFENLQRHVKVLLDVRRKKCSTSAMKRLHFALFN